MTPEVREKVMFGLDTASNDPRVPDATRKEAERTFRNLRALARWEAGKEGK